MKRRSFLGLMASILVVPFAKRDASLTIQSRNVEKCIRPPLGWAELKEQPCCLMPGYITYVSQNKGRSGFWPIFDVRLQDVRTI